MRQSTRLLRSISIFVLTLVVSFYVACDGLAPSKQPHALGPYEGPQQSSFPGAGQVGTTSRSGDFWPLRASTVTNFRGFDGDYDLANKVFLLVYGNGPIGGAFLDDNGNQIGNGFQLSTVPDWSQLPKVACSDRGVCLAVWHDARSGQPQVFGRIIRYRAGGTPEFIGSDFLIGGTRTVQESPASVAYSSHHQEFIVVWSQFDLFYRRVGLSGQFISGAVNLTNRGVWYEQPNVAYNPQDRSFNIISMMEATENKGAIIFYKVQAGTGNKMSSIEFLDPLTPAKITDIEYDSLEQKVLASWYYGAGFRAVYIGSSGQPVSAPRQIFAPHVSYDGFDMAFNAHTQTFLGVFHGQTANVWGAELDRQFGEGTSYEMTAVPGNIHGVYVPAVVAHPMKPFWLVIGGPNYGSASVQKIVRQ